MKNLKLCIYIFVCCCCFWSIFQKTFKGHEYMYRDKIEENNPLDTKCHLKNWNNQKIISGKIFKGLYLITIWSLLYRLIRSLNYIFVLSTWIYYYLFHNWVMLLWGICFFFDIDFNFPTIIYMTNYLHYKLHNEHI